MTTTLPSSERTLQVLDSPVRRQIIDLLGGLPAPAVGAPRGLTASEIADSLGLHVTTARFHLDQLVACRLVDTDFVKAGVGRPRKLYHLRSTPLARTPTDEALAPLTALLAETWEPGDEGGDLTAEQAGERWALKHAAPVPDDVRRPAATRGEWLGKIGRAVDLLEHWGYQPEVRTEEGGRTAELTLVECPFIDLADTYPDVVSGLHRGLLRGALRSVGEDETEISVRPIVGPRLCLASVRTRHPFRRR